MCWQDALLTCVAAAMFAPFWGLHLFANYLYLRPGQPCPACVCVCGGGVQADAGFVPLECGKGDLVLIHGAVDHLSLPNTSGLSRHTFQLHMVEGPGIRTLTSFRPFRPFRPFLAPFPALFPHHTARSAGCSTACPCLSGTDRCLYSDAARFLLLFPPAVVRRGDQGERAHLYSGLGLDRWWWVVVGWVVGVMVGGVAVAVSGVAVGGIFWHRLDVDTVQVSGCQ